MKGKEPTEESKARYIRRHEVSFSSIQGDQSDIELDISDYEQKNKQERNFDQKTKEGTTKRNPEIRTND